VLDDFLLEQSITHFLFKHSPHVPEKSAQSFAHYKFLIIFNLLFQLDCMKMFVNQLVRNRVNDLNILFFDYASSVCIVLFSNTLKDSLKCGKLCLKKTRRFLSISILTAQYFCVRSSNVMKDIIS